MVGEEVNGLRKRRQEEPLCGTTVVYPRLSLNHFVCMEDDTCCCCVLLTQISNKLICISSTVYIEPEYECFAKDGAYCMGSAELS